MREAVTYTNNPYPEAEEALYGEAQIKNNPLLIFNEEENAFKEGGNTFENNPTYAEPGEGLGRIYETPVILGQNQYEESVEPEQNEIDFSPTYEIPVTQKENKYEIPMVPQYQEVEDRKIATDSNYAEPRSGEEIQYEEITLITEQPYEIPTPLPPRNRTKSPTCDQIKEEAYEESQL